MRKSLLFGLILLIASCSVQKEKDFEDPTLHRYHAVVEEQDDSETRVYADSRLRVHWNEGDHISIFERTTYNREFEFLGDTGDTAGDFEPVPSSGSGYHTGGDIEDGNVYAIYPYDSRNKCDYDGKLTVTFPSTQHYKQDSFGIGANIMVAKTNTMDLRFMHVGGYRTVRLYGAGVSVSSIKTESNGPEYLSGRTDVTIGQNGTLSVEFIESLSNSKSVELVCDTPVILGSTASEYVEFWFVLPPGVLSEGFTITITDSNGNEYTKSTSNPINILSGVKKNMPAIDVTSLLANYTWESMGTGKFYDRVAWEIGDFTTDVYVDVEIEKDLENPYHYRLVAPYNAAFSRFNYKPNKLAAEPDPYFEFFVEESGYVDYPQISTGIYYRSYRESTYLLSPTEAYDLGKDRGYNLVARYQEDGITPANVLIAPTYYWPKSDHSTNDDYYYSPNEIQILFPGVSETVYVSCSASFSEIADNSVEQPIALINVSLARHIASAKVIIAQDKAAAEAAAASEFGGEATTSSVVEVNLPADAESANYYIYLLPTPAEGLSPILSRLVESKESFRYIRADRPDITVEDVVGTYTATDAYVYFNKPYWDAIKAGEENPVENEDDETWYGPFTVSFTLEESDDEALGDVMMTAFNENAVGNYPIETPIYAMLDPVSGSISFAPMQPIRTFTKESTGEVTEIQLANGSNFAAGNLVFELSPDMRAYTSQQFFGYVYYCMEQDGFNYPNIWFSPTNVPLTLVRSANGEPSIISVESVSLNKSEQVLVVGETTTLVATVLPCNATDKSVSWASSNTSVATVSSSGVVTARAAGNATITASAGGKSATCTITVKPSTSDGASEDVGFEDWK